MITVRRGQGHMRGTCPCHNHLGYRQCRVASMCDIILVGYGFTFESWPHEVKTRSRTSWIIIVIIGPVYIIFIAISWFVIVGYDTEVLHNWSSVFTVIALLCQSPLIQCSSGSQHQRLMQGFVFLYTQISWKLTKSPAARSDYAGDWMKWTPIIDELLFHCWICLRNVSHLFCFDSSVLGLQNGGTDCTYSGQCQEWVMGHCVLSWPTMAE